jgi:hypothetical protein
MIKSSSSRSAAHALSNHLKKAEKVLLEVLIAGTLYNLYMLFLLGTVFSLRTEE